MLDQIELHEGFKSKPYKDSRGILTIGIGYNLDARGLRPLSTTLMRPLTMTGLKATGITREEARSMALVDIRAIDQRLRQQWASYDSLDPIRQRVMIDLAYNLGTKLASFKAFGGAAALALTISPAQITLRQACWDAGAFHLMDSLWARQVDDGLGGRLGRADRLCTMWRTGKDYTA